MIDGLGLVRAQARFFSWQVRCCSARGRKPAPGAPKQHSYLLIPTSTVLVLDKMLQKRARRYRHPLG